MSERSIMVRLRANVQDFKMQIGSASSSLDDLAKKAGQSEGASKTSMGRMAQSAQLQRDSWQLVGTAVGGVGAAWTGVNIAVAKTGIEYNTLQQKSRAALTTILGSAEAANTQLAKFDDFARTSPFGKDTFLKAQQQMLGFGIEAEKVIPYLSSINEAVAATGGSNQDISELTRIFSQVQAASKITAVDLMQFGQRGVDAATLIGSQMGKTGAEIRDQITKGTLPAGEALDALAAGMQERFEGASAGVKETMAGAIDRVSAAFRDLSASIMDSAVSPEGGGWLVDMTNQAADFLRAIEALPGPVKTALGVMSGVGGAATISAGAFLLLLPRIIDTIGAWKEMSQIAPGVTTAIGKVGRAAGLAGLAFLGWQIVTTAVGKLVDETQGIDGVAAATERLAEANAGLAEFDLSLPQREFAGLKISADSVGDAFEQLQYWQSGLFRDGIVNNGFQSLLDMSGLTTAETEIKNTFAEIDRTLASLDAEPAAVAFRKVADGMREAGAQSSDLIGIFSNYAGEVEKTAAAAGIFGLTQDEIVAGMEGQATAVRLTSGAWADYGTVPAEVAAALDEAMKSQGEFTGTAEEAVGALGRLFEGYDTSALSAESAAAGMEAATAAAEKGATASEQQEAALKAASAEMVNFSDGIRVMSEEQAAWYGMVSDSSGAFVDVLGTYDGVIAKNKEVAQSTADASKSSKDSWETFYVDATVSLSDWLTALDEQVAAQQNWQANLLELSTRVSAGLMSEMESWGPGGAAAVQALTGATDAELAKMEENFRRSGSTAGNDFASSLDAAKPILDAVASKMGQSAVAEVSDKIASGRYTLQSIIDSYDLQATIDANADPAIRAAQAAMARINAMNPTMNVTIRENIQQNVTRKVFGQAPVWTGGSVGDVAAAYGLASGGMSPRQPSGVVHGPGTTTSDSVNTRLSRKEFVTNALATDYYGHGVMYAMNARVIPREHFEALGYADGGTPSRTYQPSLSPAMRSATAATPVMEVTNHYDVRLEGIEAVTWLDKNLRTSRRSAYQDKGVKL